MTQDNPSDPSPGLRPRERFRPTRIEEALRGPFLLAFGSALFWLLVASVLTVVTSLGLGSLSGGLFRDHEFLTHGRVVAVQHNLFIYGWGCNAFFALNLWLLAQLGRFELRSAWLAHLGGAAWNLALAYGVCRLFAGELNGYALLEMPREVGPVLAGAFLLIALWPIVAYARRPTGNAFVSQWLVVGASFVFPLVFLLTQLLVLWQPASGVVQALAHGWFIANLRWLWLGASALAAVYYFLPKLLERMIAGYTLTPVAFWSLFLFAGWTGPAALIGSPVPLWLQSTGIVAAALMLIPVVIIAINLLGTLSSAGGWARAWNDTTLRFLGVGIVVFTAYGLLAGITAFRGPSALLRFTSFDKGLEHLLTYGFVTMVIFGAAYFILPRLTGTLWPSAKLVHVHFWSVVLGLLGSSAVWLVGGWQTGRQLADVAIAYPVILRGESTGFLVLTLSSLLLLIGHLAFALNVLGMISKSLVLARPGRHG